jgi:hypothetical protein
MWKPALFKLFSHQPLNLLNNLPSILKLFSYGCKFILYYIVWHCKFLDQCILKELNGQYPCFQHWWHMKSKQKNPTCQGNDMMTWQMSVKENFVFLLKTHRFRATCSLHLQGQRISQTCYLLHAGFLLGLCFSPEDAGNMFFQNVSWLSMD